MPKRYANPLRSNSKRHQVEKDMDWQERGRDWLVFPGYKYLGLNSSMDKGPPKDALDKLAYLHDMYYIYYTRIGLNPYKNWNWADAYFLRKSYDLIGDKSIDQDALATSMSYFTGKKASWAIGAIGMIATEDATHASVVHAISRPRDNPFAEMDYEEKENQPVPAPDPEEMDIDAKNKGTLVGVVPCYLQIGVGRWKTLFPPNIVGMNHK